MCTVMNSYYLHGSFQWPQLGRCRLPPTASPHSLLYRLDVSSDLPTAPQVANCGAQLEPSQPSPGAPSRIRSPALPAGTVTKNSQEVTVPAVRKGQNPLLRFQEMQ